MRLFVNLIVKPLCDFEQVQVLERTKEAGKKILMSGGTRCNVMPTEIDLDQDFFTDSPKSVLRAIFASWGIWDCWSWLSDPDHVGLQLELEEDTQKCASHCKSQPFMVPWSTKAWRWQR